MPSRFAIALKALLDETNLFERKDWADVLGPLRTVEEIEDWVSDVKLPPVRHLSMIWTVLETSSGIPPEPIAAFEALYDLLLAEISPCHDPFNETLRQYMARKPFDRKYHGENAP